MPKRCLRPLLSLSLCLAIAWLPALWAQASSSEIDAQVDKYFRQAKTVGGSLIIMRHGEIVYERDYGYSDKAKKIPVTQDTYFRIASITKMVSAIGVMRLVEEGKLSLDADISDCFGYEIVNPKHPKIPITLRQCMTHTTSLSQGGGYSRESNTIYALLAKKSRKAGNFTSDKPGNKYAYSNFGAGLMGAMMEAVTGVSINRYMTEAVFAPLGIDAAYTAGALAQPEMIASQYQNGTLFKTASKYLSERYEDTADPERHYRITVGDVFIRSRDMAKLAALLCGDGSFGDTRLLSQDTVAMMRMDQRELNKSVTGKSPYGLCVNRIDTLIKGRMIYGHQGMSKGAMCIALFDPDTQFVMVMFTNGCSQALDNRIGVLPRNLFKYTYPLFGQE